MHLDPAVTDPDNYKVILENERVRVLEYKDKPGDKTHLHHHPDSMMYFLSSFKRKIEINGKEVTVDGKKDTVAWLNEQDHFGSNIGDTETHVLFVELKEKNNNIKETASVLGPNKEG